ncbi:MAG: vanadium-dependent haloperoxidase [Flavisolibacter sp.]|nr:vanadium-dependent haloperoxidase [Flavisolibacter sp.]
MIKYLSLILLAGIISCRQKGDYKKFTSDPLLYCKTVKKLNDVVLNNNFPPMIASRNYAYANIAAYECIVAGDSTYQTLAGQIRHLPPLPKPSPGKEVDYQLAALLAFTKVGNAVTFPEGVLMDYYEELSKNAMTAGIPTDVLKNTITFSDTISRAILEWAKGDNYAQTRSAEKFTVLDEDGRWVPTPPMYAQALEPHWCDIRPMLLDSATQFKATAPPKYDMKNKNSPYCKEAEEVKKIVDSLTEEQKHIADFFDDNPFKLNVTGHVMFATKKFSPPGHWMNIVGIAAQKAGADFNSTVAAYAKTAIALFDGFISCWKIKYKYNTVRPETVINKYMDQDWQPYIQTPPFPSYVSGHSVISAAAAEVLTQQFGDNFQYTDTSEIEFGIPNRSFRSFRDAALEASWSRLYGGIHFRCDLEEGNKVGRAIGEFVVNRVQLNRLKEKKEEKALAAHAE